MMTDWEVRGDPGGGQVCGTLPQLRRLKVRRFRSQSVSPEAWVGGNPEERRFSNAQL
jgi:hypothetical protein